MVLEMELQTYTSAGGMVEKWDPGPETPLKLKSGTPGPPSKFKSATAGLPTKFKSGSPSPFFNQFIFFRIFIRIFYLFIFVSFLNKIQKNINCE